jgi:molybdopterin synthase catalytic subunit
MDAVQPGVVVDADLGVGPGVGGGARPGVGGRVALADVREAALSVDECLAAVASPGVGGIALFVGTVRNNDHGIPVAELEYTAHPRARAEVERVAAQVATTTGVLVVAAVHRVGVLAVGDVAVVVAAGAAHRAEAFAACRQLIDKIKESVPIWKRQVFKDGSIEWVGGC